MLFSFGTLDVLLSRNFWNRRVGVARLDPPHDLHLFFGPWMVVFSKAAAPKRHS